MATLLDRFTVQTVADAPALAQRMEALVQRAWPAFVVDGHAPKGGRPIDWPGVYARWPHLQFGLLDRDDGSLVAAGNCLVLAWDGPAEDLPDTGWTWAMAQGEMDHTAGTPPTLACALSITVDPDRRGQHLSRIALVVMRDLARRAGMRRLVAPVRPIWKARYPITPMADFVRWTTAERLPLDPWMRVHARLGARTVKPCEQSMSFAGTVAEWEAWTGLALPADGDFVVPECLAPLHVDTAVDECIYVEPNVWMEHRLDTSDPLTIPPLRKEP